MPLPLPTPRKTPRSYYLLLPLLLFAISAILVLRDPKRRAVFFEDLIGESGVDDEGRLASTSSLLDRYQAGKTDSLFSSHGKMMITAVQVSEKMDYEPPLVPPLREGEQHLRLPDVFQLPRNQYLYVTEAILNFRYSSISLMPIHPHSFYDFYRYNSSVPMDSPLRRRMEINYEWDPPERFLKMGLYNYTQLMGRPCKHVPMLVVEWDDLETGVARRVNSLKCESFTPNEAHLMDRIYITQYTFPTENFVLPLRAIVKSGRRERSNLRVYLETAVKMKRSASFDLSLLTRSTPTSMMRYSRRRRDELRWLESDRIPPTVSACLARTNVKNVYNTQIVWYQLKRLHFSHVYVSMQDGKDASEVHAQAEIVRKTMSDLGMGEHVTVAEMRFPGLIDWGAGKYFQNVCFWHARDLDALVGVWDFDELPVFNVKAHREIFDRFESGENVMYDYLHDLVTNGSKLVTWHDTVVFSNGTLQETEQGGLKYFQRPSNAPPPLRDFADYTQFCLAGHHSYLSPPAFRTGGKNRTGSLALDFPTRSVDYQFFQPPKHAKCFAITETQLTVGIHKHSTAKIRGVFYIKTPYASRILLDPEVCAMHHFVSMFGKRHSRVSYPNVDPKEEFATFHAEAWREFLLMQKNV